MTKILSLILLVLFLPLVLPALFILLVTHLLFTYEPKQEKLSVKQAIENDSELDSL